MNRMSRKFLSLAAGAITMVCVPGAALAQDASAAALAEQHAKVKIASGLIVLGRSNEDPVMLYVAAKLLSGLGANVIDPGATGEAAAYDVSALVEEAKAMAAGDEALMARIEKLPTERAARSGERYCAWDYQCLGSGTFECDWVYSCGY